MTVAQMEIYDYLAIETLKINETIIIQDIRITRHQRFYEVETNDLHEAVKRIEDVFTLLQTPLNI